MDTLAALSEIAPTGVLRIGINVGNPVIAQADADGGNPRGVGPSLGLELARQLGVTCTFVTFDSANKLAAAVANDACDIAFLAIDPARAADMDFSGAYAQIEGTYMVPMNSPLAAIDAVDQNGMRIAVGLKTAYDLYLTRNIKRAQLVRFASSALAIDGFLSEGLEVVAGVRQALISAARHHPQLRVIDGRFMVIRQAAGIPKGRARALAYLIDFIEQSRKSGLVADALQRSGATGASLATDDMHRTT